MTLAVRVHDALMYPRRVRALADHAARLIPPNALVLDVGTGDGQVAAALVTRRPDVQVRGLDVLVRATAAIDVAPFDGRVIPMADRSVDVVMLIDVLHHADDPLALLREGARVARSCIVLKDHVCDSRLARSILRFMDVVGNERHGVALPHNYWSSWQWSEAIDALRLARAVWRVGGLGIYPLPVSLVFGGRLHVLARLDVPGLA
jgi:SAM-dependent methyltransferase